MLVIYYFCSFGVLIVLCYLGFFFFFKVSWDYLVFWVKVCYHDTSASNVCILDSPVLQMITNQWWR